LKDKGFNILGKSGYQCLRDKEGQIRHWRFWQRRNPIIILDILLPEKIDGYKLGKQLKTDSRYQKIPMI